MNLVKPFNNKTLDVNMMQEKQYITMDFSNHKNAHNFVQYLQQFKLDYECEIKVVKEL